MSRVIKFRAWHEGHPAGVDPQMIYDQNPGDCLKWKAEGQSISGIMQYTGLQDSKGVDIYEGDILECTAELLTNFGRTRTGTMATTLYEVKWLDEGWGKKVLKSSTLVIGHESNGVAISAKYSLVCGNIYENPELLEGK